MPIGTPIIVNGLLIGYSGNTGNVDPRPTPSNPTAGAHLHLGKFMNGNAVNPGLEGFSMQDGFIYDTGEDSNNGEYVRIFANGAIYVYCHLSKIVAVKNQQVVGPAGGRGSGSGTINQEATMPFITEPELADFREWKNKGMYYENKLIPAMQADKIAWLNNFATIKAELETLQNKPPEVQKAIELCTIDVSDMPAEDVSWIVKFAAWITGRNKT